MRKALAVTLSCAVLVPTLPISSRAQASGSLQSLSARLAGAGAADAAAVLNDAYDGSPASAPQSFQALSLPSGQPNSQAQLKQEMLQELDVIQSVFAAQYGPGLWKESHEGWNLDAQIAAAKAKVNATPNITISQYHDILRGFFTSMDDFHVSVSFDATEASSLPFGVAGANGRYFISWIDRSKLSQAQFPFNVGDELVSFGGRPVSDVVAELKQRLGNNTAITEQALAAMMLTSRSAASYGDVQQGPVAVSVLPKGSSQAVTENLKWNYTPEEINEQPLSSKSLVAGQSYLLPNMGNMLSPMQSAVTTSADNPFDLGGRDSFVPTLGQTSWKSDDNATFNAYIYKDAAGHSIGYIRIPSYEVDSPDAAVAEFAGLIKNMQSQTDALVIDQVDNPGGVVLYVYAIASMLTDHPLSTPAHHVAITQDDVAQALQLLKVAPLVTSDDAAQQLLGPTAGGYPVDLDFFKTMATYSQFVVDQWNQGKTLTDPVHIEGVDQIKPSAAAQYTKPILLLINELDFSGGDFFPAIMQDNKRATLFGTRTAGAGGFIRQVQVPNQVGINQFVVTGSIAVRAGNEPIENLGVKADVQYALTPDDLQNGFSGYKAAVNAAVDKLIGSASSPAVTGR